MSSCLEAWMGGVACFLKVHEIGVPGNGPMYTDIHWLYVLNNF